MNIEPGQELLPDSILDIRAETCPMTFVRTRLALDRLRTGQVLKILLQGEEPVRNVPKTAVEQGHTVLAIDEEAQFTAILLRKG